MRPLALAAALALSQGVTPSERPFVPWEAPWPAPVNAVEFSPDGTRLFAALDPARVDAARGHTAASAAPELALYESRREGGSWSAPELLPFAGTFKDYEMSLSPDGSFAVFNSWRPPPEGVSVANRKNNLWLVRRTATGWGTPRYLSGINRLDAEESYGAIGPGNRLIYVREGPTDASGADFDLHLTTIVSDDAPASTPFEPAATRAGEGDPWFARDGTYVIFTRWDRAREWQDTVDLYITFDHGGRWSDPVPIDELNGPGTADYAVSIAGSPEQVYWKRGGRTFVRPWGPILERLRPRGR